MPTSLPRHIKKTKPSSANVDLPPQAHTETKPSSAIIQEHADLPPQAHTETKPSSAIIQEHADLPPQSHKTNHRQLLSRNMPTSHQTNHRQQP